MSSRTLKPVPGAVQFELLDLHVLNPRRYPHLLQSVVTGSEGQYDLLFAFPTDSIRSERRQDAFLDRLDDWWQRESTPACTAPNLPFASGWFLYLGYELAADIEPRLELPGWPGSLPVAVATRITAAVLRDTHSGKTWISGESADVIEEIEADIHSLPAARHQDTQLAIGELREDPADAYLAAVRRILDYIVEGDVFQVNLSREWRTALAGDIPHAALYGQLRAANPGPFNGMATWGDVAILSSSPERLVRVQGSQVETRPIAGTRPRARADAADQALSLDLFANAKERAEHIMLIDLERNDLGRIAVPGSVRVDELMTLESYATVHHIVSNISARRRNDVSPVDIIRAVFPGGTITGCPKVRCMEIIAELEGAGRGPYTGSMGYLDLNGNMDLNILIRTMVREGDRLSFRAGAGIVADSSPKQELAETRAKAGGMLRALGVRQ